MSQDSTQSIVEDYIQKNNNIILLKNEKILQSSGRNMGITFAKTSLVAYIDAHSFAEKEWLEQLYSSYSKLSETDDKMIGVGSIYKNAENTLFSFASEIAFESIIIGTTKSSFLKKKKIEKVDNAYACLYDKKKLTDAGLYNPELAVGEDMELNNRLTYKLGYNLYVNPDAITYYFRRNTISGIFKQQINYGFWRIMVLKLLDMFNFKVFAPGIFLLILFLLFVFSFFSKFSLFLFIFLILIYLLIIILATIYYSFKSKKILGYLIFIFPAIHFGYGFGVLKSLLKLKGIKN
jgi:cellulose synthase/poly-beta-1,6-N-acetylglucosamine synthase-like glycosyltransferase